MRGPTLLLALLSAAPSLAREPERSIFETKEQSSESVWVTWSSCLKAMPVQPTQISKDTMMRYCLCATDASRIHGGVPQQSALAECLGWSRSTGRRQPFLPAVRWPTETIITAIGKCEEAMGDAGVRTLGSANARFSFCACATDGAQATPARISDFDTALCVGLAKARYPPSAP
jgi:hypothetical protein